MLLYILRFKLQVIQFYILYTANEGDYSLLTKELTFNSIYASNERQVVAIDLIEDGNEGEEDELFYVLLHPPPEVQSKTKLVTCVIHVG